MTRTAFTHLDKVFWPKEGFTKGDVIRYYGRIADVILPYLRDRPMVLNRHPDGIKGFSFFQKNVDPNHLPSFVETVSIRAKSTGRNVRYVVCNNKSTLLYLANLGCIEMHPWLSRVGRLNKPDFLVIDIDPGGNSFDDVITVGRAVNALVAEAGAKALVKTSGKRGLHVILPLRGNYDFERVRAISKLIARIINKRLPKLTSLSGNPAKRRNKIYLDYARNSFGQTVIAPYALRAFPGATVATPIEWRELRKGLRPHRFRLRTIFRRVDAAGDRWRDAFKRGIDLNKLERRLNAVWSTLPKA